VSALALVREARALAERGLVRPGPPNSATGLDALRHREARLVARAARAGEASAATRP
jgi:hypothetical protein